jgi:hypothetical protein
LCTGSFRLPALPRPVRPDLPAKPGRRNTTARSRSHSSTIFQHTLQCKCDVLTHRRRDLIRPIRTARIGPQHGNGRILGHVWPMGSSMHSVGQQREGQFGASWNRSVRRQPVRIAVQRTESSVAEAANGSPSWRLNSSLTRIAVLQPESCRAPETILRYSNRGRARPRTRTTAPFVLRSEGRPPGSSK